MLIIKILPVLIFLFITILIIIASIILVHYVVKFYVNSYFKSQKFLSLKSEYQKHINNCNELNAHIESLKYSYLEFKTTDLGESDLLDDSYYNYERPERQILTKNNRVYNCSSTVCSNANNQPIKYLCKYFNIELSEENLEKFEYTLNNFAAVEQGKVLLSKERESVMENIFTYIPKFIVKHHKDLLIKKLEFNEVDFSDLYFPIYTFQYISPGGYSSMKCDIKLNIQNLEKLILYISELIKFRKSVKGQRLLMTTSLREKIKKRDDFTCQKCSNSTYNERNLLLEIDHIIPVSLGGLTIDENLQTLCWKCNRSKGAKLF
jgi:hypothetical protein